MYFIYNNTKVLVHQAVMVSDLRDYYVKLVVATTVAVPIETKIELELDGVKQKFVVKRQEFTTGGFNLTLITEKQNKTIKELLESFTGSANVKQLLQNIGIETSSRIDTSESWWSFPQSSTRTLIETLGKYAVVPNGGAPIFYINLKGEIDMVDYVRSYNSSPTLTKAIVKSDVVDTEWMIKYPGNLRIYYSSVDNIAFEDVINDERLTWARKIITDTTGHRLELEKQSFKNKFNRLLYTSEVLEMSDITTPLSLGQTITINRDMNIKFVVDAVRMAIPINGETPTFNIRAVCPLLEL